MLKVCLLVSETFPAIFKELSAWQPYKYFSIHCYSIQQTKPKNDVKNTMSHSQTGAAELCVAKGSL